MSIEAAPRATAPTGSPGDRSEREHRQSRMAFRRAVEAVVWGMPAVNFDLMLQAFLRAGGQANQIAYWSRLLDGNAQTLTPNPDVVYVMPFYDTKAGPVVLEIPPAEGGSITGSIDDAWQNALEDVGPAGADKGAGGKYLILPPDHDGKVPQGYAVLRSMTFQGFALLRSNIRSRSDADVTEAVAYARRIGFYTLGAEPAETRFVDLSGKLFDATIPYDRRFFASLARIVAYEPWLTRDKAMIDHLKAIGIAKGTTFDPDRDGALLDAAAEEAKAWLADRYEAGFAARFYSGSHWALPAEPAVIEGMQTYFAAPDDYPTDGRGVIYSMGYFSAKHLGEGQFYLVAIKDSQGQRLDGSATYRLTVPARAPVKLYWSATVYDAETHALVRGAPRQSRASNAPDLVANPDGSVDLWFGPEAPPGKAGNWAPTQAGRGFEVMFRFYGPEPSFFEKQWALPDLQRVA